MILRWQNLFGHWANFNCRGEWPIRDTINRAIWSHCCLTVQITKTLYVHFYIKERWPPTPRICGSNPIHTSSVIFLPCANVIFFNAQYNELGANIGLFVHIGHFELRIYRLRKRILHLCTFHNLISLFHQYFYWVPFPSLHYQIILFIPV